MAQKKQNEEMSYDTKVLITVLALLFIYPLGLILMWLWTKWPKWVKIVVTLPLILIPILAVLLATALIAINPSEQFKKANDVKRQTDVVQIHNAVLQYQSENQTPLPVSASSSPIFISSQGADLCALLVPEYLAALPVDPAMSHMDGITDCSASYDTGYSISSNSAGMIIISAPVAENEETITSELSN